MGLALDNCGRTTKNAYCRIYSLCSELPNSNSFFSDMGIKKELDEDHFHPESSEKVKKTKVLLPALPTPSFENKIAELVRRDELASRAGPPSASSTLTVEQQQQQEQQAVLSPRKKPRKQQLQGTELKEGPLSSFLVDVVGPGPTATARTDEGPLPVVKEEGAGGDELLDENHLGLVDASREVVSSRRPRAKRAVNAPPSEGSSKRFGLFIKITGHLDCFLACDILHSGHFPSVFFELETVTNSLNSKYFLFFFCCE